MTLGHDYWLRVSDNPSMRTPILATLTTSLKKPKAFVLWEKSWDHSFHWRGKEDYTWILHQYPSMTTCNSLRERSLEYSTVCTIQLTETLDLIHNDPEFKILLSTDCLCWFQLPSASETPSLWVRWKIWMSMSKNMDALSAAYCWCVRYKGCVVCLEAEADSLCEC